MRFKTTFAALALFGCQAAWSTELFETNPTGLYPPGCVSNIRNGITTPTFGRQVYASDIVPFTEFPDTSGSVNVMLEIFRRGCAEQDRSVLYMTVALVTANDTFLIPRVFAEVGGTRYPLRLVREPNSFEGSQSDMLVPTGSYEFIVDGVAESRIPSTANILTPSQYNGAITFVIQDAAKPSTEYTVNIPVWGNAPKVVTYPLNGRQSGVWVSEGAVDQGLLISFNEFALPGEDTQQQVFFSWYTFDAEGNMLWLTAGNFFERGATQVELELELVTNGEFQSDATADREVIGTATLKSVTCAEMRLEYDLTALGLGMGEAVLGRLFSLETAGYACRDLEARLDAL